MRVRILLIASVLGCCAMLPVGPAFARSPGGYPGTVEARVHYIYRAQQLVVLEDGTVLRASSPRQLDRLHEGDTVRVQFVSSAGQKLIERIETPPR